MAQLRCTNVAFCCNGTTVFSVDGSNGRLLEVTDDLSNSIFSANTIAGLPVIEAFANNCVVLGQFGGHQLQVTCTSIRGGICTTASGTYSFVGGCCNTASGPSSAIVNGVLNTASARYSFIGNGRGNTASACYATISGGGCNTASGFQSFIGGGSQNSVNSGNNSTIGGGQSNNITLSGFYGQSTIGGGVDNSINGDRNTIGGGAFNSTSGFYTTIGGGVGNNACQGSFIGGGNANVASGTYSFVGGGGSNIACNQFSVVGGGGLNRACGDISVIGGGCNNLICGCGSFIGSGLGNTTSGCFTSIIGGINNFVCFLYCNSHIIGSCITANANNFTYVNNLCQTGGGLSDCRVKNTIEPVRFGLNEISQLRPVSFCWNGDNSCHKKYGFIAQEIQQVMSCVVTCNQLHKLGPDGNQILNGEEGEPLLEFEKDAIYASYANAIKELKAENDALKQRVTAIENILKNNNLL
jgi:hypothetical protein